MNLTTPFQKLPASRTGISFVLGVFFLVALTLSVQLNLPAPVEAAPASVATTASPPSPLTYTLDDFDVQCRPNNDFFARRGPWDSGGAIITHSIVCPTTHSCYLDLAYDLSLSGAEGGYYELLSHFYTSTWPLRDLREFEQFRFRVRSDQPNGFPDQFQIEFVGRDWNARAVYPITGVTNSWQWKTVALPDAGSFDWSAVKQVAIKLVGSQLTQKQGRLLFDDFAFVDQDFAGNLSDLIEQRAFLYFWENRHPDTGFVRDRAADPFYERNVTSVAAIGYELAAFGIGAERGWISRAEAASATHQVLSSLAALPQGPAVAGISGYRGLFYHMLGINTGLRADDSEVSTIDTALLMAGVLFARQYYTGVNQTETDIRNMAEQLYNRVEWDWMLRTDPLPSERHNQIYMAWKPERHDCEATHYQNCYEIPDANSGTGFFTGNITTTIPTIRPTTWDYYTDELLLINLLAIGSPAHPVPTSTFHAWQRVRGTYDGYTFYQSWTGTLFTYFIGQGWLKLRSMEERDSPRVNWFDNSRLAVLANRQFSIDHATTCSTYTPLSWGLSTSLGPPDNPASCLMEGLGVYRVYGALPRGDSPPPLHDCTLAPYAAAGSIAFLNPVPADNEAYQALDDWFRSQPRLWGLYGFRDGFNLDQDWFAHDYIGLDQGMTLLALDAYRTGFVWRTLNSAPAVHRAKAAVLTYRWYLPKMLQ